jgi:nuclear transcription Y subunit beta
MQNMHTAFPLSYLQLWQQQNQSNRDRVMDSGGSWAGGMMSGEKGENAPEGSNSLEGGADANYMYAAQGGHNGTGAGEGY